jgi:hypothetical protein
MKDSYEATSPFLRKLQSMLIWYGSLGGWANFGNVLLLLGKVPPKDPLGCEESEDRGKNQ